MGFFVYKAAIGLEAEAAPTRPQQVCETLSMLLASCFMLHGAGPSESYSRK
jgi:hypothetical protein